MCSPILVKCKVIWCKRSVKPVNNLVTPNTVIRFADVDVIQSLVSCADEIEIVVESLEPVVGSGKTCIVERREVLFLVRYFGNTSIDIIS